MRRPEQQPARAPVRAGAGSGRRGARRPAVCIALAITACMAALPVPADTPATGRWQPVPELWDEFTDPTLDAARWQTRNPYYPGKKPGLYRPDNVAVRDGRLTLWARAETVPGAPAGYSGYTTAYVTSRQAVRYGYFEVRARPMKARINSAFWFYRWTEDGTGEIDVFEVGGTVPGRENALHTNTHLYRGRPQLENDTNRISDPQTWQAPVPLSDDFHLYALEWDERELRFYFDNRLIRRKPNIGWHQPMYLRFSAETHPDWFGLPVAGELPAAFEVDYVRAWRKVSDGQR